MDAADSLTLAQLLLLAALTAATCEYAELVRRRKTWRRSDRERLTSEEAGLRGLVLVFLADEALADPGTAAHAADQSRAA